MRGLKAREELINKKGSSGEELPFSAPGERRSAIACSELGQVIAERGPDHVVDSVRTNTGPCHASGGIDVVAGPAVLGDVGVGQTPLHATLGSVVDLMPEAEGPLDDMVDVAGAASNAARGCWRGGLADASS